MTLLIEVVLLHVLNYFLGQVEKTEFSEILELSEDGNAATNS